MDDSITWLILIAASILIGYVSKVESDIKRINKKINWITKQLGETDTITDDLKELISEGKKVDAIKKYRIASGAGLLEAKEYVDSLDKKENT